MKIAILGGTGLIGRRLAAQLRRDGHEVRVAARSTGVDLISGKGLAEALAGAEVVVDTSNPGYADAAAMERFFTASAANLGAAAREASVRHLVALSAIGAAAIDGGYYRAKQLQEARLRDAGLPFTIVRSAPFYEFIYKIVDAGGAGDTIRLPPVHMQPIGADDVAAALARIALGKPANGIVEIAGPDRHRLSDLAVTILTANEDMRSIVVDPEALYFGARFDGEPLTGEHPRFAHTSFEAWLRDWFAAV